MADPRGDPRRNLVAVPSDASRPTSQEQPPGPRRPAAPETAAAPARSRREPWLLLALAIATVVAIVQSQRLDLAASRAAALSDQVVGLEAQLAAAETQLHTYEMQRGQIRDSVSDISERVMLLSELVGGDSTLTGTTGAPTP